MPETRQKKIKNRRRLGALAFLVLFLVAAGVVALVVRDMTAGDKDGGVARDDGTSVTDNDEDVIADNDGEGERGGSAETQTLPTIEDGKDVREEERASGERLGVWVTTKSVVNGTLLIRVQIDQNISSGQCKLTIGGYATTVPVQFEPQSASCEGFDVPVGEYTGKNFEIEVRSGDKVGVVKGEIDA